VLSIDQFSKFFEVTKSFQSSDLDWPKQKSKSKFAWLLFAGIVPQHARLHYVAVTAVTLKVWVEIKQS